MYGSALADVYDLIYRGRKDFAAEARSIVDLVRRHNPVARSLLDVACGTGEHLSHLRSGFRELAGVEISPPMLAIARAKLGVGEPSAGERGWAGPTVVGPAAAGGSAPGPTAAGPGGGGAVGTVSLYLADMRAFDLGRRFDAVSCLFSAIGYARGVDELNAAVARMAAHVAAGGLLVVEPWFTPDDWREGTVGHDAAADGGRQVVRMSYSTRAGRLSRVECHYLVGDATGVRHFSDAHELTLFTQAEYEHAFIAAGCRSVSFEPGGPTGRGLYLATM